jgi:hypothetical protein
MNIFTFINSNGLIGLIIKEKNGLIGLMLGPPPVKGRNGLRVRGKWRKKKKQGLGYEKTKE